MKDNPIIFLPKPAKIGLIVLLAGIAVGILILALYFSKTPGDTDIVIITMSIMQVILTGLGVLVILVFSRTSLDMAEMRVRSDKFLEKELPQALERIALERAPLKQSKEKSPKAKGNDVYVLVGHYKGKIRADYLIMWRFRCSEGEYQKLTVSVRLNVNEFVCVIKIPISEKWKGKRRHVEILKDPKIAAKAEELHEALRPWWEYMASTGTPPEKKINFQGDGSIVVEYYMVKKYSDEFLVRPGERLHCAQLMAICFRSLIFTASLRGIKLDPNPGQGQYPKTANII